MAELFQKSLGIREDGSCYRHPDIPIMEQGSSCLGTCHFCAMEKQKEINRDDTATTMSNSFFWSSAASLSLTSSFRQGDGRNGSGGGGGNNEATGPSSQQATGEGNTEKQQQQQFFESIVARWVQVQDGNLQQSIALSTPLILHELRKLETQVHTQEAVIEKQQQTIDELRQSIETKHDSTQALLQTILQTVSATTGTTVTPTTPTANGIKKMVSSDQLDYESSLIKPPSTRGVPGRTSSRRGTHRRPSIGVNSVRSATRSVASHARSVDERVKQPLTRHDSNRSFTIQDLNVVSAQQNKLQQLEQAAQAKEQAPVSQDSNDNNEITPTKEQEQEKDHGASQPIEYSTPLPAAEMKFLSASEKDLTISQEIALEGSNRSLDHADMPDFETSMEAIFEDGIGNELASVKKKKFQIPASYGKKPMEIILESGEPRQSERKMLPETPEEMGMDMGASLTGNAKAFVESSPKPGGVASPDDPKLGMSCVTLDAASAASELSDSESEDESVRSDDPESIFYGQEGKETASWVDDDDEEDYNMEDLQHVSRYKMIDMYGDRGTYTGTLGPDNDPTGFGTMKYDSGRFYKGEWRKGRWNGKGTLLNANGDSYQGDFVSDARHGRGVYRFTSGDVYEGEFVDDNRHGKGKFKFHNGSVYEGDFCMGSFEGSGRYDFEGGFYDGQWKRDEYYGKGKLQYKDGSNYTGRFKRGSAHGFGEERLADGTVRCGLWKRGEFLQECSEDECKRLESKSTHSSSRPKMGGKVIAQEC